MKHQIMALLKAILVLCVFVGAARADETAYPNADLLVSATRLSAMIDSEDASVMMGAPTGLRIIDVRSRQAFAAGHLPTAVNLPYTELTDPHGHFDGALKPHDLLVELFANAGIGAGMRVVLYDDEGGFRAARTFWLLEYFGHRRVSLLDGGVQAWESAGLALATPGARFSVSRGKPLRSPFRANLMPRRIASADWILAHRNSENVIVVDVRPAAAYADGHIPWAVNIPWKGSLTADLKMKSPQVLRAHFQSPGVTLERNVVVHGETGEATAHGYFTLRLLGYPRVRNYHRSWAEWGAADDLPKATGKSG